MKNAFAALAIVPVALIFCMPSYSEENPTLVQARTLFRQQYSQKLAQDGWRFKGSATMFDTVGSDWYIRDIKKRQENIRSAWVLLSFYEPPTPFLDLPVSQSSRMFFWVNCAERSLQMREAAKYYEPTGKGLVAMQDISLSNAQPAEFKDAQPSGMDNVIVDTVCLEKL